MIPAGFRVISYVSSARDEAPTHLSAAACLLDSKGVVICYVHAPTKAAAREKLELWVEAGAEKERRRRDNAAAAGQRMREAAEARRAAKPAEAVQ